MRASSGGVVVVPVATESSGTTFAPALGPSVANGTVTWLDPATGGLSPGIVYARSCADAGYTDAASGACANASDPSSFACAYGSGDKCTLCPFNSLCPGGARRWPRVGYFAFAETDAEMQVRS